VNPLGRSSDTEEHYDVIVLGYGPAGQALAAMLARRGHRIAVVERWQDIFPLPRAGHVDHEIMRVFQSLGIADAVAADSATRSTIEFFAADGELLAQMDWGFHGISGWHSDWSLFQPYLESLMHAEVARHPNVDFYRGWEAQALAQDERSISATIRRGAEASMGTWTPSEEVVTISASYLVGADGANSTVRSSFGISMTDFGFEDDWLVVFAAAGDPSLLESLPDMAQILDPARPATAFRNSGKRCSRWEFKIMPGEDVAAMSTKEKAWELIARWGFNPDNSTMLRNSVFRFRSKVADQWRVGRAFVIGDAAHLMPPFLGQGMCSGLRDAETLAWKLDLVLRDESPQELLDTFALERRDNAAAIVQGSLAIGEIVTVTDPVQAASRNEALRSGMLKPSSIEPCMTQGVLLLDDAGAVSPGAGVLSAQSVVEVEGRTGRSDDLIPGGWRVLSLGIDVEEALSPGSRALVERLGGSVVRLAAAPGAPGAATDVDGCFSRWFEKEHGATGAVIVRPDFYTFGFVDDLPGLERALLQLASQLGLQEAGVPA
jgi:2-polyprenyl-6-methoxyphenol hydroxylase-like FAD-dependent oxidoreductase